MMTRPKPADACTVCAHAFKMHWITQDGRVQGCIQMTKIDEGKGVQAMGPQCDCHGFAVLWRPEDEVVLEMPDDRLPPTTFVYHGPSVEAAEEPPTRDFTERAVAAQWEQIG